MTKQTNIIPLSEVTRKNIEIIEGFKSQVQELSNNCMLIKIMDESTLSVGQQNLSKANTMLKAIEDKIKLIRKPLNDELKQISAIGNPITELLEKAVKHIKSEVEAYDIAKKKEAANKQAEIDRQLEEKRKADEAEEKRKQDIRNYISQKATPLLKSIYEKCTTVEICDNSISQIEKNYKPRDFFQEFADEAYQLKDNYLDLIRAKREQLASADTMTQAEKDLALKQEKLALEKANLEAEQRALEVEKERIEAEKKAKEAELEAQKEKERLAAEAELNKTKNIRFKWDYEPVDITKSPISWLKLNENIVDEYLKNNKESLKDGEVVNGVRFYKKMSVVS